MTEFIELNDNILHDTAEQNLFNEATDVVASFKAKEKKI